MSKDKHNGKQSFFNRQQGLTQFELAQGTREDSQSCLLQGAVRVGVQPNSDIHIYLNV